MQKVISTEKIPIKMWLNESEDTGRIEPAGGNKGVIDI